MKIMSLIATALLCLMMPVAAGAQVKVMTGTDPAGEPYSRDYYLTMPDKIGLVLLRSAELGQDGFIMRLSMYDAHVSCAKLGPLNVETSYDAIYMDVKVASYQVDGRDKSHCDRKPQTPMADIILDKADLQARGISKIRFYYGDFSDTYNLEIRDDFVGLTPEKPVSRRLDYGGKKSPTIAANSYKALTAYHVSSPLELSFLPLDTIILYAPGVPQGQDVSAEIARLATGRGLLPLAHSMPDFVKPRMAVDYHYFTDPQNMYLKTLTDGKGEILGQIRREQLVYGLDGDEVAYKSYEVYMKKPGLYE